MLRGFLNEIKNTAINRATSRVNNMISDALGGGRSDGLPRNSGKLDRSNYAKVNPFQGETIAYPEDLGSADQGHYIVFNINEQANAKVKFSQGTKVRGHPMGYQSSPPTGDKTWNSKTSVSVPTAATKRLASSIVMYMPATVGVTQAAQYGEVEMGVFATAAANLYKQGKDKGVFNKEFLNTALDEGGTAFADKTEMSLRKAADMIASGADAAITLASGKVTNNRLEMVFQGTSRRSFSYSFKMMPKSEAEATNVDRIARMFRFYMAPSFDGDIGSSRTMIVPATFDISYYYAEGKENHFLNKISTCVLESANVTYGGDRVQFFRPHSDGRGAPPVETNIELQFKELELITREKLALGY
tara:strand:+ start:44 stop:1120 length:1077 start_codon:yes stop_codon:yes gene_type:complete